MQICVRRFSATTASFSGRICASWRPSTTGTRSACWQLRRAATLAPFKCASSRRPRSALTISNNSEKWHRAVHSCSHSSIYIWKKKQQKKHNVACVGWRSAILVQRPTLCQKNMLSVAIKSYCGISGAGSFKTAPRLLWNSVCWQWADSRFCHFFWLFIDWCSM